MKLLLLVFSVLPLLLHALEWDCNSTAGDFTKTTDCALTDTISITDDLTITGNAESPAKISALKRYFFIDQSDVVVEAF